MEDGNATLTHIGAYTVASQVLHSHNHYIPNQESFTWQAPEFLTMDVPRVPTKAMDVYAFGSTLYTVRPHHPSTGILLVKLTNPHLKVFTGVAPFDGRYRRLATTIVEIGRHGHRRLPQPDNISDGLWKVIRCCWEYDPVARPQMECVVGALRALLAHP